MTWRCKSSTGPARGTVSRTARVPVARRDLKEAAGKALARRTEIAYEAAVLGKKANIFKARYLHGKCGRKCGGHKWEGRTSYPGRSVNLPWATGIERCRDGLAEVSRGHSSRTDQATKGRTCHLMRDRYLVRLEQMSRKRALKREVSDGIREVTLGAYRASRIEVNKVEDGRNRRIRNRMYGGEGGRRARALLLPDCPWSYLAGQPSGA